MPKVEPSKRQRIYWSSKEGHSKFLEIEKERRQRLINKSFEYWIARIKPKVRKWERLDAECLDCGIVGSVNVRKFASQTSPAAFGCFCNGKLRWDSPQGRVRLLSLLDASRFECPDLENMSSFGAFTKINLFCVDCKQWVTPMVRAFVTNDCSIQCGCSNKHERVVLDMLNNFEALKRLSLTLKVQPQFVNLFGSGEVRQYTLKADIGIMDGDKVRLFVEVDGGYHFGKHERRNQKCANHTIEHDLKKEKYALEHGVPMIRISTNLVSKPEKYWKSVLEDAVMTSLRANSFMICRLSNTECYLNTVYGLKRKNTVLEVMDPKIVVPSLYAHG